MKNIVDSGKELMIKERIKRIPLGVKSAFVYTTSTVFSRGLVIITVPIFTRLMTTEQIGVVNLYNSWYSLISVVATLSLTSGGYAVAMKEYTNSRDQYESSVLSLTSLVALIIAALYFIKPSFWNNVLGLPTELMILMLFGFLFTPARDFWLARQRYEYKYKLAGSVTILSALVASVLSIAIVIYMNNNDATNIVVGRLYANYLVLYGVAVVIWVALFFKGKTFYNKEYWKMSLALSLPLVGYSIAAQVLSVLDRMMISRMVNNSAVGIYSTLYTVSSLSLLVWQAINTSFVPYLFQNIDKKENGIKKVSFQLLGSYALVAVLFTFLAPEIVRILATKEYYEAIYIMPPIAAGVFFTSVANMYSNIVVYYKKTRYVMYPAIISAVSNVILNIILIPIYGYMAAAYTTLFCYILLSVFQAILANKVHKEQGATKESVYNDRKILVLSCVTVLMSMTGLIWYSFTIIRYLLATVIMIAAIVVGVKYIKNKHN